MTKAAPKLIWMRATFAVGQARTAHIYRDPDGRTKKDVVSSICGTHTLDRSDTMVAEPNVTHCERCRQLTNEAHTKPYYGRIEDWRQCLTESGPIIIGRFVEQQVHSHTGPIVAHNRITGALETAEGRYTLVPPSKSSR